MSRLVFLGLDGLDPLVLERHADELPALARLRDEGTLAELPSIFPPDSIPAWITIFTGEAPDEHGIIESIDYLARNPAGATTAVPSLLSGRTFWDRLSHAGQRVCVVNPFMAYPAWPVNGAMISGPVFVDADRPSVSPDGVVDASTLPQLGGIVDFPTDRTMRQFLEKALDVTRRQGAFALDLLERLEPDFLFLNVLTLDRIQHFLWRYCDSDDPTYPGPNALAGGIAAAYRAADDVIAQFAAVLDSDDVLLVASDHGHGRRPTRMFYVDELLRRHGFFVAGGTRDAVRAFALERVKRAGLRAAYHLRQEERAFRLAKRLPGRKALKTSSYSLRGGPLARLSRAFGRNSWSGIEIAGEVAGSNREALIEELLELLRSAHDPQAGKEVVLWARHRDEILDGRHAARYPDILFELHEGYGVDYGVFGPLFGPDLMHRRISGGHRRNGVFGANRRLDDPPRGVGDLYETVVGAALGAQA